MSSVLPRGIRKRGSSYFVDVSYKGSRLTQTCATLQEAKDAQVLMKAEVRQGVERKSPPRSVWTLRQALDATIPDRWKGKSGEASMTIFANEALKFFGEDHPITSIDTEAGKEYIRHCRDRLKNADSTINKKVSALRVMLVNAAEYRASGLTAVPELKAPARKKGGRKRFFSAQEEAAILDTLAVWGKGDHADCVTVLIQTGLRPVELYAIERQDVLPSPQHKHGVLMIYGREGNGTKNGENRSVPMTARAAEVVYRRLAEMDSTSNTALVFPFNNRWMRHTWDNVRDHLGMSDDPQFVTYTCRHTCASRMVMQGIPLPVVQQWLGHSNITQTMNYAHLSPTTLFNAAASMDDYNDPDDKVVSLERPVVG